jgi:DNA-directed RNA polymerase specialized sigma24 family protein
VAGDRPVRGRSSFRTWLHRIATNVCLDEIARRPKRVLPIDYGPPAQAGAVNPARLDGSIWLEPYPDKSIEIADDAIGPEARYEQREVSDVDAATEEAFRLGADVLLAPREGPAGWRAVVATQDGGPLGVLAAQAVIEPPA